jgi:hypothetical protein
VPEETDPVTRLRAALAERYGVERELGHGGMATVYLAHDVKHDRDVALKVLRPELAAVLGAERFLAEIRISARLDHPHILTLIDSGQSEGFLWYVLPYVRGESLRARLEREHQLPIPDAVAITKQIASALDYAHRQGVIHRDVKPENILLQEGEAVLTDFGIALAVKEAAGNRLTETGLSLGTPQYMSPEQATGERRLDARSDVYSLAAVLYEMLTGEPPHSGATAQVVIAKLMTERPTPVRVLRDTVPEGIDAAVARGLAKVPADRFASADAFVRALEFVGAAVPVTRRVSRRTRAAIGAVALLVAAVGLWALAGRHHASGAVPYTNRTQVTFTGDASEPALSPDGSQLAYVVTDCASGPCNYALDVKDLGGGGSRRLVSGAALIHRVRWSPDRRFLLFHGVVGSRPGAYLVPLLGGAPRFLTSGLATFAPAGDSVVLTSGGPWLRIAPAEGPPEDSLLVRGLTGDLWGAAVLPGGRWLVVGNPPAVRIIDRLGTQRDSLRVGERFAPGGLGLLHLTSDAIWFDGSIGGVAHGPLVRVPLDPVRGKFGLARDTVMDLAGLGFDVTRAGATIAYGEGVYHYSVWALPLSQALQGRFDSNRRLGRWTSLAFGLIAPDGKQVLVGEAQGERLRLSILPWAGGPGVEIPAHSDIGPHVNWTPDGFVALAYNESSGVRFAAADPKTGATVRTLLAPDSLALSDAFVALSNSGWAWTLYRGRIRVQYPDDRAPRDIALPGEIGVVLGMQAASDGRQIAVIGYDRQDSLLVYRITLPEGTATRLGSIAPPNLAGDASWLGDGGVLVRAVHTLGACSLYRVSQAGRVDSLGTIPQHCLFVQSALGGRVAVTTWDVTSDIWLARRSSRARP